MSTVKELPSELLDRHQNGEQGFWIWASREIADSDGDIIRVDGIELQPYHNPPATHLKVLAQHLSKLPDGTAPVVGVVTDFVKTNSLYNNQTVKGLALYVEYLTDQDGKRLPLSEHYYQMMNSLPAPGIDTGSVGIQVLEYKVMESGGLDVIRCSQFEFSLVTVPANASAVTIKALQEKFGKALIVPVPANASATFPSTPEGEANSRLKRM
jgi:hypothetical protein